MCRPGALLQIEPPQLLHLPCGGRWRMGMELAGFHAIE
jgi:hypothetical protein